MDKTAPECRDPNAAFDFDELVEPALFRALGDSTRLALLGRLAVAREPLTVTEVASCCGVHLSGVSRHLKMLHAAGLVAVERQGREVRYQLRCAVLSSALRSMADALDRCAAACCTATGACGVEAPKNENENKD